MAGGIAFVTLLGNRESKSLNTMPVQQAPIEGAASSQPATIASGPSPADIDAKPVAAPIVVDDPSPRQTIASAEPATADLPPASAPPPKEQSPVADAASNVAPVPQANSTAKTQAEAPAVEKQTPRPVMNLDPLDFDPSRFSFHAGAAAPGVAETDSIPKNADVAVDENGSDVDREKPLAAEAAKVDRSLSMRLGPMPNSAAPPRLAEQLGKRVESVAVANTPLSRLVEVISALANVAVTLDPIELELAGVKPQQEIGINANGATVEQLLRDALRKQRLELVERDGQLGIALFDGEKRKEVVYDVADLAGSPDAAPIARLVQRFVAPESWTAAGGGGTIVADQTKLRIEQSQRVRHQALIFCERLRLVRGLSQRSRYPASLLATESPDEAAAPTLESRTTFTFLPWTRFGDVLHYWQGAAKLTVLVDWRALADMGIVPSSPVACSANDRTWRDALDGVLEPIGLAWWMVNAKTIQITSREALGDIRRIEFHAVSKAMRDEFDSSDALVESLRQEWAELGGKRPMPVIEYDEPSDHLIVLGTPSLHRFLTKRLTTGSTQVASQKRD